MEKTCKNILEKIPSPIPLDPIVEKYPVRYDESMNTVLIQEVKAIQIIIIRTCTVYIHVYYFVSNFIIFNFMLTFLGNTV